MSKLVSRTIQVVQVDGEKITYRWPLSYGDNMYIADAPGRGESILRTLERLITAWTLHTDEGRPIRVTRAAIDELDEAFGDAIVTAINAVQYPLEDAAVPNGSGGASADGSSETPSPTPAEPTQTPSLPPSTTSSSSAPASPAAP